MGAKLISKLFLTSGSDLQVTQAVTVRHPTVSDVLSLDGGQMCEDLYWSFVSTLLSDPYDYMVYLDDQKIDYESVTAWDVFVLRWYDAKQEYMKNKDAYDAQGFSPLSFIKQSLSCFFGQKTFDVIRYNGEAYLVAEDDPRWVVNKEIFVVATEFIEAMHCIDHSDRIKPATPFAKQILIEDTRAEQKRRLRKKQDTPRPEALADALTTVFAGGAGTITPDNFMNAHIYQLLSVSRAVQKQVVVQSMFNGIYTGMLKTDNLSEDALRWV